MNIRKKLLILPIFFLFSDVHADNAISDNSESLDLLTKNLFEIELVDNSLLVGMPLSENDYKSVEGARRLYCASVADFTAKIEDGQKLHDNGMNLLNNFARKHAVRDQDIYLSHKPYLYDLINFHQSWMIDNSEQLKGMIFYKINKIIENDFYMTDPLGKKGRDKLDTIYERYCSKIKN